MPLCGESGRAHHSGFTFDPSSLTVTGNLRGAATTPMDLFLLVSARSALSASSSSPRYLVRPHRLEKVGGQEIKQQCASQGLPRQMWSEIRTVLRLLTTDSVLNAPTNESRGTGSSSHVKCLVRFLRPWRDAIESLEGTSADCPRCPQGTWIHQSDGAGF